MTDWRYEVVPDRGRWRARQFMNHQLLKSCWFDTEEQAQDACKGWAAAASRRP